MSKIISRALAGGLLLIGISVSAQAQDTLRLRVALVPATPALAVWVAQDKGFFAAQGIDVAITPMNNVALIPTVLGNQFDIGTATTVDLIRAAAGGMNVVAIAANHFEIAQASTNALVARREAGLHSVKDLEGKTLAAGAIGSILQVGAVYWLKKDGIDISHVHFVEVPFPNMADEMKKGLIDAAAVAEPFAGRMVADGNLSFGNLLLQIADPSLATLWMSDRTWAQTNQSAVAKWTAALQQSARFIAEQPAEARAILVKYTKLPPSVVEQLALPHFETKLQSGDLIPWIKVLNQLGQIQGSIDPGALLAVPQ